MGTMTTEMRATLRKLTGTALLWVALAALVNVPSSGGVAQGTIVAAVGFVAFAFGLALFTDGLKRDIVEMLRREPGGN